MPELERLASEHLDAVLVFERENRAYFARSLTDRGDEFYDALPDHHQALLDEQDLGMCAFFVLIDRDESILGRFNLYDISSSTPRVGYRVAEQAAGTRTRDRCAPRALSNRRPRPRLKDVERGGQRRESRLPACPE